MQKKSMQIVVGIVVVVIVAVGAYLVFHKSPVPPPTTNSTPSTQTSGTIIQTKTASNVGQYLADSSGAALYTYGNDTVGKSNCTGSCLASWPAYTPSSSSATLPANVSIITGSDGSKQYAYKGMPLYTFSGDSSGQVSGDNVNSFHVAKP